MGLVVGWVVGSQLEMILVDHLISETDEPENPWTFVPDGDLYHYKQEKLAD